MLTTPDLVKNRYSAYAWYIPHGWMVKIILVLANGKYAGYDRDEAPVFARFPVDQRNWRSC
jgi:hypothetical protein